MLSIFLFALLWPSTSSLDIDYGLVSQERGLTAEEKKRIVDIHNIYRQKTATGNFMNKPKAANMVKLTWNETLAESAQEWADNCGGPNHNTYGQNIATSKPPNYQYIILGGFPAWCENEAKIWVWTETEGTGLDWDAAGAGHFTQVVWANSWTIGCGFNSCKPRRWGRLVCNFIPYGNYVGEIPYIKGRPCSKCPAQKSRCVDGALCSA